MLKGNRINVNKLNLFSREFDSSVHSTYTESELNSFSVITKDMYDFYLNEVETISKNLNLLIK